VGGGVGVFYDRKKRTGMRSGKAIEREIALGLGGKTGQPGFKKRGRGKRGGEKKKILDVPNEKRNNEEG